MKLQALCLLGVLISAHVDIHAASGWLAEGRTREVSVHSGKETVTSELNFRFLFDQCRWELAIAPRELGSTISTEILYDGTNITTLSAGGGVQQGHRFEHQAARYAESIPPFGGQAAFVWLALGSGCELADQPSEFRQVVFTEFEYSRTAPIVLAVRNEPPGLPQSLLFLSTDGTRITNAVYRALSYTNHSAVFVPSRFEMNVLGRSGETIVTYEGFLTNLQGGVAVRSALPLPPQTLVNDLRFAGNAGERGFDYMTNKWLSRAEAQRRPEFQDSSEEGNTNGGLMIFLIVTLFGTAVVFFLLSGNKTGVKP